MSQSPRPNSQSQVIIMSLFHDGLRPTQAFRRFGVSRKWIYQLIARYKTGGLEALEPRSTRPLSNPRGFVPRDTRANHRFAPDVARLACRNSTRKNENLQFKLSTMSRHICQLCFDTSVTYVSTHLSTMSRHITEFRGEDSNPRLDLSVASGRSVVPQARNGFRVTVGDRSFPSFRRPVRPSCALRDRVSGRLEQEAGALGSRRHAPAE